MLAKRFVFHESYLSPSELVLASASQGMFEAKQSDLSVESPSQWQDNGKLAVVFAHH